MRYANRIRLSAVKRLERGESLEQVSKQTKIPQGTLIRWRKTFASDVKHKTRTHVAPLPEALAQLRGENQLLRDFIVLGVLKQMHDLRASV